MIAARSLGGLHLGRECPRCGAEPETICIGWYVSDESELVIDGFDGDPCPLAADRCRTGPEDGDRIRRRLLRWENEK